MNIYDKLAKALAFRKYSFTDYMYEHEYTYDQAIIAYVECRELSIAYGHFSTAEIEELLDNQPIVKQGD